MILKTRIVTLSIAAAIAATGLVAVAGDLNPPVGPVAPTHKTLTEVEPRIAISATNTPGDADSLFKITQPGSYYLTGNITGVVGKHGIEIASSGVTLDLNGFDLAGVPAMGAFDGVNTTAANLTNIAVVNGSVRAWGDEGVDVPTALNCHARGVRANGNAGTGISLGNGATITQCSATGNTGNGIVINNGSTATDCSAVGNTGSGIRTNAACTVTNCSTYGNSGDGIATNADCTVSKCTASSNAGNGIVVGGGCIVADCAAGSNTLDGIRCSSICVIRNNACRLGGFVGDGAGIHATSTDNRIEGNNCIGSDRGIDVDVAGNIIIRNTCSGNTINWDIVANNVCGPILDRTAPASAAILGNSAPSSLGSTDANANFSY